ncbi:hypothetical protein [Bacillus mycoides]|uniref:hypothetical protein n=1 Tax=Bacillus mycoides TaxID=1405 RepID=UPI00087300AA|nr:hypothetical protein [Bacillus mycoides]OFD38983.1 hypothetical protein BWGOE2_33850 [Bacillus mycoides]OFD43777.1 hypothetical protein BWGOE1_33710 [Bacillus mycoides]QWH38340.1 hypothetical protein EXW53_16385 [Bacillus mycoides]
MPLIKEKYELKYRDKEGKWPEVKLVAKDFRNAEIEALKVLENNEKNILFNKDRNIKLIKYKGKMSYTYDSVWKKFSPLSNATSAGGYIEGFSKHYSKKARKKAEEYIEKSSKKQYKNLKIYTIVYWVLSLLIAADMISDFFMRFESKKAILAYFGIEGVSISITLQSLFLFMLIISAIFQPIVYENFRENSHKWSDVKIRLYLYEIPSLVSTVSTAIALIFIKDSVIIFGDVTLFTIILLLILKIFITIEYERNAFYQKIKDQFHNK